MVSIVKKISLTIIALVMTITFTPLSGQTAFAEAGSGSTAQKAPGDYVLSSDNTEIEVNTITYNGQYQIPDVAVYYEWSFLELGRDYTLQFTDSNGNTTSDEEGIRNAGVYWITVVGMGDYTGSVMSTFTVKKASIKKASLKTTSFVWNGNAKKPGAKVYGLAGTLLSSSNYSITHYSGSGKVGKHKVTIKGKGNYKGAITKYFTVKPARAALSKKYLKYRKLTVRTRKAASGYGAAKFQIAYKKPGGSWRYIKTSKRTKILKRLAIKRFYRVKVRALKKTGGKTYYGKWSIVYKAKNQHKVKVKFINGQKHGYLSKKSKKVKYGGTYGSLPIPEFGSGYKFTGWYTKKSGGKKVTKKSKIRTYKTHKLYAHWRKFKRADFIGTWALCKQVIPIYPGSDVDDLIDENYYYDEAAMSYRIKGSQLYIYYDTSLVGNSEKLYLRSDGSAKVFGDSRRWRFNKIGSVQVSTGYGYWQWFNSNADGTINLDSIPKYYKKIN